ncbi:MAG: hypothetical protein ACHBN1_37300 [Heteroscytonema crispum UTEX LB 1556]
MVSRRVVSNKISANVAWLERSATQHQPETKLGSTSFYLTYFNCKRLTGLDISG